MSEQKNRIRKVSVKCIRLEQWEVVPSIKKIGPCLNLKNDLSIENNYHCTLDDCLRLLCSLLTNGHICGQLGNLPNLVRNANRKNLDWCSFLEQIWSTAEIDANYWNVESHVTLCYDLSIENCNHYVSSPVIGSIALCDHNISKNPSRDLTLLAPPTTVKISPLCAWPRVSPQGSLVKTSWHRNLIWTGNLELIPAEEDINIWY